MVRPEFLLNLAHPLEEHEPLVEAESQLLALQELMYSLELLPKLRAIQRGEMNPVRGLLRESADGLVEESGYELECELPEFGLKLNASVNGGLEVAAAIIDFIFQRGTKHLFE